MRGGDNDDDGDEGDEEWKVTVTRGGDLKMESGGPRQDGVHYFCTACIFIGTSSYHNPTENFVPDAKP
jgi:hypothetical protein